MDVKKHVNVKMNTSQCLVLDLFMRVIEFSERDTKVYTAYSGNIYENKMEINPSIQVDWAHYDVS